MSGHVKPENMPGHELSRLARFRLQVEAQLLTLGKAIERERKAKSWSRARLAREIPVDPKTVERWEKGTSGGAMESLGSIAGALGVEVDQILVAQLEISREDGAPQETAESDAAVIRKKLDQILDQQATLIADVSEVRSEQEAQRKLLERAGRGSATGRK